MAPNCYRQLQVDVKCHPLSVLDQGQREDPYVRLFTGDGEVRRELEDYLDQDVEVVSELGQAPSEQAMSGVAREFLENYNRITNRNLVFKRKQEEEGGGTWSTPDEHQEPTCVRWEYHEGDLVAVYNYGVEEETTAQDGTDDSRYHMHLLLVWFQNPRHYEERRPRHRRHLDEPVAD